MTLLFQLLLVELKLRQCGWMQKGEKNAFKCLCRALTQEIEKIVTTVLHAKVFYVTFLRPLKECRDM